MKVKRESIMEGDDINGRDVNKIANVVEVDNEEALVEEILHIHDKTREVEMLDKAKLPSDGKTRESETLMNKVVSRNGKSRTTFGQIEDKGCSVHSTPSPKRLTVHWGIPINPVKDPGRSLKPSHELKENVNSKCSRVWRVKDMEHNLAWMAKNKSGGKPLGSNKLHKRGWDPPAIYATNSDKSPTTAKLSGVKQSATGRHPGTYPLFFLLFFLVVFMFIDF